MLRPSPGSLHSCSRASFGCSLAIGFLLGRTSTPMSEQPSRHDGGAVTTPLPAGDLESLKRSLTQGRPIIGHPGLGAATKPTRREDGGGGTPPGDLVQDRTVRNLPRARLPPLQCARFAVHRRTPRGRTRTAGVTRGAARRHPHRRPGGRPVRDLAAGDAPEREKTRAALARLAATTPETTGPQVGKVAGAPRR